MGGQLCLIDTEVTFATWKKKSLWSCFDYITFDGWNVQCGYSCDHWLRSWWWCTGCEGVNMINNPNFLWQPNIKYIYGYGCLEIVDKLDLEQFLAHISQNHRTFAAQILIETGMIQKTLFSRFCHPAVVTNIIVYISTDQTLLFWLVAKVT